MKLRNPTVVITGGTGRLGLVLARESISLGYDVVLHYRTSRRGAPGWLRRESGLKERVRFVQQDLLTDAPSLIDAAAGLTHNLTGLVNNASVFTKGNLDDNGHLEETLAVNALVPLDLIRRFSRTARKGWVINMTDANVKRVILSYQNYRLSKLLLAEITRQAAALYAPRIRVNAIAPGAILPSPGSSPAEFRSLSKSIPLGRTGTPRQIAQAFAYLVQNVHVTGEILSVDGGRGLVS